MSGRRPDPGTVRITAGEQPARRGWEVWLAVILAAAIAGTSAAAFAASGNGSRTEAETAADAPASELRLGYFGNVTHAPALAGVQNGFLAERLRAQGGTKLSTQVFNAGPAAIEALNAGAIDAAYLGPNPAINSFVQSGGESISVIAGATAGGAQLVAKPEIVSGTQLKDKVLATPQLGGTQDVALRAYLRSQGLSFGPDDGDVTINPTENAQTLKLFQDGKLDGAWLPEPWASRLVLEAGAKVLVDEADLWDGTLAGKPGQFSTTVLVVNREFAAAHPQAVDALLQGHVDAIGWLNDAPAGEQAAVVNAGLKEAAGAALPENVVTRALGNIEFTPDPLAGSYPKLLQDGVDAGLSKPADLTGLFDLAALNRILAAGSTHEPVTAAGLGAE
ncbi:aliphatic sulfonates family ABC transporter periplasmic ligand-binding protein [Arthrobacter crystallopoietes BAB-32]|uniref:Aliphatic sulfonates family ABC transporter periplasmic ligand-binding protein n=1 Tax=Arthrobacter crystallopoietes BAB-32 TaxID=1246476 RepID=N1V5J4_9MICC|nr:ABC transporter substrate-binding protein [Arthrobacter crystallopoietes]EMY35269.1 aliphatic sulfonates family ABC transporter periplasmic ligand-binding protein [Arthrobacter crystallopoietes BAB-32]